MALFSLRDIALAYVIGNIAEKEGRKRERMKLLQSPVVAEIPPKQPTQQNLAREVGKYYSEVIVFTPRASCKHSTSAVPPSTSVTKGTPPQSTPLTEGDKYGVLGILLVLGGLALTLTGAWKFWLNLFEQLFYGS